MQRNQSNEEEDEVEIGRLIYLSYGPMVSARVIPTLKRQFGATPPRLGRLQPWGLLALPQPRFFHSSQLSWAQVSVLLV